jgi:hypothetical protein
VGLVKQLNGGKEMTRKELKALVFQKNSLKKAGKKVEAKVLIQKIKAERKKHFFENNSVTFHNPLMDYCDDCGCSEKECDCNDRFLKFGY